MPAGTVALLASALLHAGWNALLKREREPETAVFGVLAVAVALAVALPLVAWSAARRAGFSAKWRAPGARQVLAGLLCTGSFLLFLVGLAQAGAGPALTLRNTSVVFAQGLAALMGEPVPRRQLLGAALVATGATLLAWG